MPDPPCIIEKDEIRYAIAKQTSTIERIETSYGEIDLDDELNQAVQKAVERVLYKRLGERPPLDTIVVELAPVQREALGRMVDLTGVSDDSLAQAMFDYGFETMDGLARWIK
jgi:hypothetical protein